MRTLWKCIFIVAVIISKSSFTLSSFIYQNVTGTLTGPWTFNFTMFANNSKGVILYIFDSERNQFGMIVKIENDEKYFNLKFNGEVKVVPSLRLCGCKICNYEVMKFYIEANDKKIKVRCNNNDFESLPRKDLKNYDNAQHSIPKSLVHLTNIMIIMMGNIGSYISEDNTKVSPFKDQMVGCVKNFHYKGREVSFIKEGRHMETFCSRQYFTDCNGGVYRARTDECDCSSTTFNGPYCNRSMKMYLPGRSNSYEKIKKASFINLKMTWSQLLDKKYCLMEVEGRSRVITIWINKSYIMMDNKIISDNNLNKINFMNINIRNNYLNIKIKNKTLTSEMNLFEETKINIGKCNKNKNYETFEGPYDFHFDSSQLRLMIMLKNLTMNISKNGLKNNTKNISKNGLKNNAKNISENGLMKLHIYIIGGLIILCGVLILILCISEKTNRMNQKNQGLNKQKGRSVIKDLDTDPYSTVDYNYIKEQHASVSDEYVLPSPHYMIMNPTIFLSKEESSL